ncbi:hypothetical protein BC938DRAFT_475571 [Jimgerdemannia flammicorona]|uniref:Uncharacterized protein n=1 Tax=Jimgerdemannia flammicorona TaxID=994334 RepID=A0A433PS80_9FUNG|nr:hypothetical protein BC938DRAFT_475571 [Jimgerdemannia flammicorona]
MPAIPPSLSLQPPSLIIHSMMKVDFVRVANPYKLYNPCKRYNGTNKGGFWSSSAVQKCDENKCAYEHVCSRCYSEEHNLPNCSPAIDVYRSSTVFRRRGPAIMLGS